MKKTKRNFTYKGKATKRVKKMRFVFYLTVFIIFLIGLNIYQKEYLKAANGHINALKTNLNTEIQKYDELQQKIDELIDDDTKVLSAEEQIIKIANEENFTQTDLLVKIAFCESSLNPLAVHYNKNGSSDYGIFQFNSIHKFGEKPLDIEWATKKTIEWIKAGKLHAWNSSKKCWSK